MRILCEQPALLAIHSRLRDAIALPNIDGDLFFLAIPGRIEDVYGSDILKFASSVERCKGIVLFFMGVRFKQDKAREFTPNIKFFIDGIESTLKRHVLIVGCSTDKTRTAERYILNEDRWPQPDAQSPNEAIHIASDENGDMFEGP